ncbi:hypothetical protein [Pelagibius sp.]|uniref:hypothetical protein n=1 Tax=Pelagibius sp. TaxID=1931238 RepID=UPI0026157F4B|nr:hypothetical protein [Pelagibius sp.]
MAELLKNLTPLLVILAALIGSVQAVAEPASPAPGFTVSQLIKKLEKRFPNILKDGGSLTSADNLQSDLLVSTNPSASLETLGQPKAVRGFVYSYDPGVDGERQQSRQWAGMIIRNALPGWRKGKSWVRRAIVAAEKDPEGAEISETAEGYWIAVRHTAGRVRVTVMPVAVNDTDPESLGLGLSQLLNGLESAFPEREEGMGSLYGGDGWISDRFFTDNAHGELETLGPVDQVIGLRYHYALRQDDHPEATADNRGYALALVRNVFPNWAGAEDWMTKAIDAAAAAADQGAEPIAIEQGPILLRVRYFVGATESIEVMIHPKDTYL